MSLITELEDMTLKMSPRFMNNIRNALDNAVEETTPMHLEMLRTSVTDFIEAVKIMGLDELRTKLEQIGLILTESGPAAQILQRFKGELAKISDNMPAEDREFLKKKEPPAYYMEVSVDQSIIDSFMTVPGINEERARTLYFSGFVSMEDLEAASVAKLFGVPGMTLAVAKKIADHFNPNRLIRLDMIPQGEAPANKAEISFVGKAQPSREGPSAVTDEIEPGEDDELLALFIEHLTEYLEGASTILQNLSSPNFPSEILLHLQEITHGLAKAAHYMGYEHIQSMAERIETTVGDVVSGDDQLTRETLIFLNDSIGQLTQGCESLKRGTEKLKEKSRDTERDRDSEVSLEYNVLTMAHYWGELHDLYKDTHELLRRVSQQGNFTGEDIDRLRKNTHRLDEMAGSISELVEDLA